VLRGERGMHQTTSRKWSVACVATQRVCQARRVLVISARIIIERVAWIAGCVLLATYAGMRLYIDHEKNEGVRMFVTAREGFDERSLGYSLPESAESLPVALAVRESLELPSPDTSQWSNARKAAYATVRPGAPPLGVLRIEAIDLTVPIYEGDNERNLNRGAAWIRYTAPLGGAGNAGLAAHRDGYFRALRHVRRGDRITVETMHGTFNYIISTIRIVTPSSVEVLAQGNRPILTLVTCYPFYFVGPAPQRFIVQADLI
jgi:LPXTG-site transpeptidase (sortase) family protein